MSSQPATPPIDAPPPDQASGTLFTAVLLSMVAGWVDAHIYLHVTEVFVANMSGNLIELGMFTGLADWSEVWPAAAALVAFVAGAALGTRLNRRELRHFERGRARVLLIIEAGLLLVLAVALLAIPGPSDRATWPAVLLMICVGSAAMGLQAAALGRVGTTAVTTTYGTGSLIRVGQQLVRPAIGTPENHRARNLIIVVMCSLLASYVTGAALSALAGGAAWLMIPPVVVMLGVAWWSGRPTS